MNLVSYLLDGCRLVVCACVRMKLKETCRHVLLELFWETKNRSFTSCKGKLCVCRFEKM